MNVEMTLRRLGLVCVFVLAVSPQAWAVTLSEVADQIGARTFYDAGITGTGVVLGNVEAGHVDAGNPTLDQSGRVLNQANPFTSFGVVPQRHSTQVSGVMVAENNATTGAGIAFGAKLRSGQIATSFGLGGNFNITGNSLLYPLMVLGQSGVDDNGVVTGNPGDRVDVINSSWGGTDTSGANSVINVLYDHLAVNAGVTMVVSSGNAGQGSNTVGTPANSWNVIAVGATNTVLGMPTVTSFSSGGKVSSFNLSGTRTKPDIVAPGLSIVMPTLGSGFTSSSGTSFAAPIVAASAGLLIDLGKSTGRSTDPRVVKAVLLNSATKLTGWSQAGTTTRAAGGGRVNDTVVSPNPLDAAQGAGFINLTQAYDQYTAATDDVSGMGQTSLSVANVGWDLNTVSENNSVDYLIDTALMGQTRLTATLVWFMDRTVSGFSATDSNPFATTNFFNENFDDLDLFLFEADANGQRVGNEIAASISGWNAANPDNPGQGLDSVEHLYFDLPHDGRYVLQVAWRQEWFDFLGSDGAFDTANAETFALAWEATAVPGPSVGVLLGVAVFGMLMRRRVV